MRVSNTSQAQGYHGNRHHQSPAHRQACECRGILILISTGGGGQNWYTVKNVARQHCQTDAGPPVDDALDDKCLSDLSLTKAVTVWGRKVLFSNSKYYVMSA